MKVEIKKEIEVDARTLHLHIKVRDSFGGKITDKDGCLLVEKEDGYVPDFMPGQNYGDYLILDINLDTGQILNWNPPRPDQLRRFIEGNEDE